MIERHWNPDLLAKIFGLAFVAVGIIGFFDNPIVSSSGVFLVNDAHNLLHIVTGVIFLAGAFFQIPVLTIRTLAVVYTLVAIFGFAAPASMMFGEIAMNLADRWLHLVLAAALLLVGFLTPAQESIRHAHL